MGTFHKKLTADQIRAIRGGSHGKGKDSTGTSDSSDSDSSDSSGY